MIHDSTRIFGVGGGGRHPPQNRALLTAYLGDEAPHQEGAGGIVIDYAEFPDAAVPEWLPASVEEPAGFQEYVGL